MSLPGAPQPPRSCLDMVRSPVNAADIEALRARAWHEHQIAALPVQDITDPWLRQAITNEANRRWGRRNGGQHHGW